MDRSSIDELADVLRATLAPRMEIREAYLFGSTAHGASSAHSDVDVAVWLDEARMPESGYGYEAELSSELMRRLGRNEVDVVRLNAAPPLLYHRVLRDGVRVLARDLRDTTVREGRALSRWCDWAPTQARIDTVLASRHRNGELGR